MFVHQTVSDDDHRAVIAVKYSTLKFAPVLSRITRHAAIR